MNAVVLYARNSLRMRKLSPFFWLAIILLVGLALRLNAAADPFLHEWDERFHALVAKNLLLHPLLPTLYEQPVLPFDFRDWSACHLWLSKGPLPLWAMAGSFQLFGISEWSLRLPSLLFSMGGIWMIFEIGRRLFDARTGLWAAFFQAIHGLTIEVAGGKISSDHAETAFLFFAELAFFFIVIFHEKQQKRPLLLAGMAVGAAFLCKWTAAFVVLFLLVASLFLIANQWQKAVRQVNLVTAAFLLIAVPWSLFLWKTHPMEAAWMFRELLAPTVSVVQNHGGEWWFYLDQVRMKFGELIYLPLGWLVFRFFRKPPVLNERLLVVWSILPMVLLSIFATKRSTYLLLAGPGLFLLTAHFLIFFERKAGIWLEKQPEMAGSDWTHGPANSLFHRTNRFHLAQKTARLASRFCKNGSRRRAKTGRRF